MQTNDISFLQYQELVQKSRQHLRQHPTADTLLKLSQQLSKVRCTLQVSSVALLQNDHSLPAALKQVEIVLLLSEHYRLSDTLRQLVVSAGFCSALCKAMPIEPNDKLQAYPALLAANTLKPLARSKALQSILINSYPGERGIARWQQQPLSLFLTLAEYLSDEKNTVQQQIGYRIAVTKSDEELQLLRQLLILLTPGPVVKRQPVGQADFIGQSQFASLINADNKTLEHYLLQAPELSAPVLAQATNLNRQKQQVTNLHLALNLLGRDLLPAILTEAELHYRLCQLNNPAHTLWQQFSHCLAHALALLSPLPSKSATYWQALSLCLCVPFWLSDTGYSSALLTRTAQGIKPSQDDSIYQQNDTLLLLTNLLQHYQLPDWQLSVSNWLGGLTAADNKAVALAFAWHSCKVLLLNRSQTELSQCARPVNMPTDTIHSWLQLLAQNSGCYFPLSLSL